MVRYVGKDIWYRHPYRLKNKPHLILYEQDQKCTNEFSFQSNTDVIKGFENLQIKSLVGVLTYILHTKWVKYFPMKVQTNNLDQFTFTE